MNFSPRFSFAYLSPQQAQKHVTVNEALRRLDALVSLAVRSRGPAAEPAAPAEGDAYIMAAAPSGAAWSAFAPDSIAVYQDGAWANFPPVEGLRAFVIDEALLVAFAGGAWNSVGGGTGNPSQFGVNATPDATNRLAVKSDAVLFSHDDVTPGTGDMRHAINKSAAAKTASHLFQTGFSGRAEFGLIGDNDFRIKVSANGAAWNTALVADRNSGFVGIGAVTPRGPLVVKGRSDGYALQFTATDVDSGGYLTSISASNFFMSQGAAYEGLQWVAKATTASVIGGSGATIAGYCNSGLTAGNSFAVNRRILITENDVSPGADNIESCGTASLRWTQVFAVSGAINTSDARDKELDGALDAAEMRVARRLLSAIGKYRWKEAIARKGAGARLHVGLTAQAVHEAFAAEGLDAARYGLWCEDEIIETVDDPEEGVDARPTGRTRQGLRYDQLMVFLIAALAVAGDEPRSAAR